MRSFGYFVLVVGLLCIVGAFAMDVSVSSGVGRVNNIGLMAERQNLLLVGGLMLLVGVIMAVAWKRQLEAVDRYKDVRSCPSCAESIKCAAVKCKHCGSEVESIDISDAGDARTTVESMDGETITLWVARGSLLTIFVGIILFSTLGK